MTRVASIAVKSPRLAFWSRRESRVPAPRRQQDPAEQAAASRRSESHYRRVRDVTEASFFMNGGRYL
jgi:hypothetical protein